MSVLITGSLAYDTVLYFDGRFSDHIPSGVTPGFNTTFLARSMHRDFGGCAGNIAYAMKRLGGDPQIWGAVGKDGGEYLKHLKKYGISTNGIAKFRNAYTAQCQIFTDATGSQIAAFHPGATERTPEAPFPTDETGAVIEPDRAILSPGGYFTTKFAIDTCFCRMIFFYLDLGQELPLYSKEELLEMVPLSLGVFFSESEALRFTETTGCPLSQIAGQYRRMALCTHGERGASLWLPQASEPIHIEALPVEAVNPVGAGDALRGGFMFGVSEGLSTVESARLGSVVAGHKVKSAKSQGYELSLAAVLSDYERMWGIPPRVAALSERHGL